MRPRGFTLIELLVVLLVMGLLAGLVSAVMRPDDRGLLRLEAERLAQLLDLAASEARYTGNALAWTADGSGYRFWRRDADWTTQWSEILDNDLLRARALPQDMRIASLQIAGEPARDGMRLAFAPYAPALPFRIELALGAAHVAVAASAIGELRVSQDGDESRD